MVVREEVHSKGKKAKEASRKLATLSSGAKDAALKAMAEALLANSARIIEANALDIKGAQERNLKKSLIDRLLLNEKRIKEMAEGLVALTALPDPIGEVMSMWKRPNGLQIGKRRVPLGVIGIIYEARPNVTVDAAGLCLKTGNAVILRGGSEAINSNKVITDIIAGAAVEAGMPDGAIQLIETTDREAVDIMLKLNEFLDVLIPRGGAGLIQRVVQNATVPVIQTGVGNCHVYVENDADLQMAEEIIINAKCQRPGVCNAIETILVQKEVAPQFLPGLLNKLREQYNVEIRGDEFTKSLAPWVMQATEEDWYTEYNDFILAVRVVENLDEALGHIYKYGTKHSEAIITSDYNKAQRFLEEVDAAAVYVNASTRFTDGFQFGFGAEIGISTQKLHARGPMGLNELTTIKYIIYGNGQIRQ